MRKNINKLVALAIGISVMSGSVIPAFADDAVQNVATVTNVQTQANGKPLLTLEDAINGAISNSDKIAVDTKKINYQDQTNDLNDDLDDANDITGDKADLNSDTRDNTLDQLKQQRDFDEDTLDQQTTTAYNGIVTSQKQIDRATKALGIQTKLLNDAKLKNSLGIMTTIDLTSTQLQIESLQNQLKSSQNALKDAEYSFNVLTGKDVTKYTLQQDIPYETFKVDGSIDDYLDDKINTFLEHKKELYDLDKDYYKDNQITDADVTEAKENADNAVKPTEPDVNTNTAVNSYQDYMDKMDTYNKAVSGYTGMLSARLAYLNGKLDIDKQSASLDQNKKQFKNQLKTLYTNLLTAEDTIATLKKNIDLNNKQLSNTKLKYDLGMITESDYDSQVLTSIDLDLQLRTNVNNYNTLKQEIEKPWITLTWAPLS